MIRTVIHNLNDTVAVFDEKNQQIPRLQGKYDNVAEKILAETEGKAVTFYVQGFRFSVARELFANKKMWKFLKGQK